MMTRSAGETVRMVGIAKRWPGSAASSAALDDVSFDIAAGAFCVLLGPSGCGKTTLLRIVAGLKTASAGRVEIGGRDVTALPPAARGLAMVFQSYALFPHLSVAENILFGLKARRVPAQERAARLDHAAGLLGLGALLARKPGQLSGGQQQRVALGRAIVAQARVCLMDEPLSNLDAQLRAEMRREIHALQCQLGITVIYVTHDQTEAMAIRFGKAWLDEVFAEAEQLHLDRDDDLPVAAAISFALKEAVSKVIGTGFGDGVRPYNILVDQGSSRPTVCLAGPAARRVEKLGPAGEPLEIVVAVRHDNEWVTAICLITLGAVFPLDLYAQLPELPPRGPKSKRS